MAINHIETARISGTVQSTFVREPGKRGELLGLAVAGGIGYHYVIVTLDGQELANNYLAGIAGGPSHGNNGLSIGLRFEHELAIDVRNGIDSAQTVFWTSYRIDGDEERDQMIQIQDVAGVPHAYRIEGDSAVLIGPALSSHVILDSDTWLPGYSISGRVVLRANVDAEGSRSLLSNVLESYPTEEFRPTLAWRVAGKSRLFPLQPLELRAPELTFEISDYALLDRLGGPEPFFRRRGFYGGFLGVELVADIRGFANFPSDPF
jgi:hypothetical protein